MAREFGIVRPGSTLYVPFDSFAGSTGASITLTGLAVTDIEIYKDGSTTQRASDNGYTLLDTDGIDFDGLTGIHGFSINLADNSDAGFYAAGSRYFVVVSSVTVDSQTVSFVAARFTIGQPAAILNTTIASLSTQTSFTLTSGPAEDDAFNGMWIVLHDVASAVQQAVGVILDYVGSTKTVTLAAAPTFTIAATDNISVMGPIPLQPTVGAIQSTGRTLTIESDGMAHADVKEVAGTTQTAGDIIGDTNDIQSRLPSALVGGRIDANVGAISADATAADNAEAFFDGTGYAGTNNVIPTVTTVTNSVSANVTQISGDTVAADNLEAALDGTGGVTITAGLTGNVTGNLSGSVGSLATQAKADVNAEVVDALATDTYAEPGQGAPAATTSLAAKINYLYKSWRNKKTQTSTTWNLFADDTTTVDQKATVSDDGTTATKGEIATGP